MINKDRIVPVTATDLITLYGLMLNLTLENGVESLAADDVDGNFTQNTTAKVVIANEPVSTFDFGSSVATGTVYFVPAYDYVGFTKNGASITSTGEVDADGNTLYKAVLASNAVTITKLGF
jgi:hypothetical protein